MLFGLMVMIKLKHLIKKGFVKMVKITQFKSHSGKIRYQVIHKTRFLGGGFASKKSAEKYKKYVLKHKKELQIDNYC